MARQRRISFPGALFHVRVRGNDGQRIYLSDADREEFNSVLAQVVERFSWICHTGCQMDNHFHLIVETPVPNLSHGMRQLNGCYAQDFNRRMNRTGHLFQGRYKATLIEKDSYLLEVIRYVNLNPVRAGRVENPEEWGWSSYRSLAGFAPCPAWLTADWLLRQFSPDVTRAQERFRSFVREGIARPKDLPVRSGLFLGSDAFVEQVSGPTRPIDGIPRREWRPLRPALPEILHGDGDSLRAARDHGYTLGEIAEFFGVHLSTISRRLERT